MEVCIPGFHLALTAASGQSFRFHQQKEDIFLLIAMDRKLLIQDLGEDRFSFSCDEHTFEQVWRRYFDLNRDYGSLAALLPKGESYLSRAYAYAKGVRILHQDPFETLIAFIISQRKSIPAIKTCVANLAKQFGAAIDTHHKAFPSPVALAQANPAALVACGLGYRTSYVQESARMVAEGQLDLHKLHSCDDQHLEEALMRFPGVGKKVAACVMLFAYQRMDAFPVDVWIQKVFEAEFKDGFPYGDFPGVAGIIQQYLFCYARHQAGRA